MRSMKRLLRVIILLMLTTLITSSVNVDDNDNHIIIEVLGPERYGRIRFQGSFVNPTQYFGSSSQQYMPSGSQAQAEVQRLRDQMAQMQSSFDQLKAEPAAREAENRNIHEGKVQSGLGVTNFIINYIQELDRFASGVIVRNAKGEVLVSKPQLHIGVGSTFAVEALVCLKAVVSGVGRGDSGGRFQLRSSVNGDGEAKGTRLKRLCWRRSREKKGPKLNNQTFLLEIWNKQTEIILMVEWVPVQ
ncbi:hypothetical protein Gotri_002353 [Gossypium trilobum]|uniref:Uncharacterized protein n=1 Tax=Gossypium trilobum TaxID=34281 RepID=A0A7J9F821_9ROSI|nr:hypothetical protein [Gossypium trilobum]